MPPDHISQPYSHWANGAAQCQHEANFCLMLTAVNLGQIILSYVHIRQSFTLSVTLTYKSFQIRDTFPHIFEVNKNGRTASLNLKCSGMYCAKYETQKKKHPPPQKSNKQKKDTPPLFHKKGM